MRRKEKRKFSRLKAYHLAKYKPLSGDKIQATPILATVKDIGGGGVRLLSEEYLPVSSLIELKINFPGITNPISVLAKIIWIKQRDKSRRYEVGAQIVEIEDETRKAIDEQIKSVHQRFKKRRDLLNILFKRGGER